VILYFLGKIFVIATALAAIVLMTAGGAIMMYYLVEFGRFLVNAL
jgi:hypothetical protein